MSVWSFAPVLERKTFTASGTATEVADGDNFRCYGLAVYQGAGASQVISIESADGSVVYFTLTPAANSSFVFPIPFQADRGMRIKSTGSDFATTYVTIARSNPGA